MINLISSKLTSIHPYVCRFNFQKISSMRNGRLNGIYQLLTLFCGLAHDNNTI